MTGTALDRCPKCWSTYPPGLANCPTCEIVDYYYPANYIPLREFGFNRDGRCFRCGQPADQTLEYTDGNGVVFPICSEPCRTYVIERCEAVPLTKDNPLFWDLDYRGREVEEQVTSLECSPDHPFTYRIMFEWESGDPESAIAYEISCDTCNQAWSAYLYRDDELFYEEVGKGDEWVAPDIEETN